MAANGFGMPLANPEAQLAVFDSILSISKSLEIFGKAAGDEASKPKALQFPLACRGWSGLGQIVGCEAKRGEAWAATVPDTGKHVVVTFSPWLYQDFEGARSALLQLVGDGVLRRASADEKLLKKANRLLQRINFLRLLQFGGEAPATIVTGVRVGVVDRAPAFSCLFWVVGHQSQLMAVFLNECLFVNRFRLVRTR